MASHAVYHIHRLTPRADEAGRFDAELELMCGCRIDRTLSGDRLVETVDGQTLAVGKYPCPVGHSVREAIARRGDAS